MVVRRASLRPCPIDGDLPKLAIRFSPRFRIAAFDRAYRRFGWPLALAESWDTRRFFCGCLFRGRSPSIAGPCSNGLCAQWHARRRSSPVFCGCSFARAFLRGCRIRVEPATTRDQNCHRSRCHAAGWRDGHIRFRPGGSLSQRRDALAGQSLQKP